MILSMWVNCHPRSFQNTFTHLRIKQRGLRKTWESVNSAVRIPSWIQVPGVCQLSQGHRIIFTCKTVAVNICQCFYVLIKTYKPQLWLTLSSTAGLKTRRQCFLSFRKNWGNQFACIATHSTTITHSKTCCINTHLHAWLKALTFQKMVTQTGERRN